MMFHVMWGLVRSIKHSKPAKLLLKYEKNVAARL